MSTRLKFSAVTDYQHIDPDSSNEVGVIIESYSNNDTINFHLETMVKFLLGCGYSLGTISKFINTDGSEVWEIGE